MGSRLVLAAGLLLAVAAAASCTEDPSGDGDQPLVVTTTTIVGDLVGNVAGDEARVETLMPIGADPHEFQPSAQQGALFRDADLVVTSGLGLEQGLQALVDVARDEGVEILELGPELDPLPLGGDATDGEPDPHWWLDPVRAQEATRLIADRLETVAPSGGWGQRAEAYAAELAAIDLDVREALDTVPQERRKLVTLHDAFRYFAARYGFEVVGVVIPGGSTEAQPSAQEIAELAGLIRAEAVPAIFGETTLPTQLADSLAREVGSDVQVIRLYTGSLDEPGSEAGTYLDMIATNARRIAEALS